MRPVLAKLRRFWESCTDRSRQPEIMRLEAESLRGFDPASRRALFVGAFAAGGVGLANKAGAATVPSAAFVVNVPDLIATAIPNKVLPFQAFRTQGYAAVGDSGDAIYVRGTSAGPMAVQDQTGQWFQLAPREFSVRAWSAKGDGTTDDSARVNAVATAYNAIATVTGSSGVPPAAQGAGIYFPAGRYLCPSSALTGTGNGWTVYGDGIASAILQGTITLTPYISQVHDLSFWGNGTNTALTFDVVVKQKRFIKNVAIRNYATGILVQGEGAYDLITETSIQACNIGIDVVATEGINISDTEISGCLGDGMIVRRLGEIKTSNLRIMSSGASDAVSGGGSGSKVGAANLHITGQSRSAVLEHYWTNLTATLCGNRSIPITSVADNGSGGTRFYTSVVYTYTAIQGTNGCFVPSIFTNGAYDCTLNVLSATLGSSVTSMLAGSTELLSGAVSATGAVISMAAALAAAINAGTGSHGYTATSISSQSGLWVTAPDGAAALLRTMVVTTSGAGMTVTPDAYTWIDLGAQHDFLVGEDISLTGYLVGAVPTYGFATVIVAPSDSSSVVIGGHVNSHILLIKVSYTVSTGTAVRPNRLSKDLTNGMLFCTGYTNSAAVTVGSNVADHYFEATNIPYAGVTNPAGTNYLTMPGWDVFIDSYDRDTRNADQFFLGGNINYVLIRSGFNIQFWGTRIKIQFWIDPRLNPAERSDRIFWAASGRSLAHALPFASVKPDGATSGWWAFLITDADEIAGNGRLTMLAPTPTKGVYNEVGVDANSTALLATIHNAVLSDPADTVGIKLFSAAAGLAAKIAAYSTTGASTALYLDGGPGGGVSIFNGAVRAAAFTSTPLGVNYLFFGPGTAGNGPVIGSNGGDGANATPLNSSIPIKYPSYPKSSLPSATLAGQLVYCSDATGGASLCQSVGGGWLSLRTGAAP